MAKVESDTHLNKRTSSVLLYLESVISVNILCFLNSCFTTEYINTSLEVATVKDRPAREGVEMSAKSADSESADSESATTAPCLLLPTLLLRSKVTVSLLARKEGNSAAGRNPQSNNKVTVTLLQICRSESREEILMSRDSQIDRKNKPPGWWKLHPGGYPASAKLAKSTCIYVHPALRLFSTS